MVQNYANIWKINIIISLIGVGCGKVKLVVYREWFIPPVEKETFVSGADKRKSRLDIPGSSVKNFCCYPNDDGTFECGHA